ncbi:GNAT family N-acetyltransferase [Luteolibacter luteus]|uniref:GNAT family N-acetyltransferase n=1 Tax=Luteolibacter luteus TaxID=2728835 RepID=A0A858RMC5_9BACT|nr:GNAT family N-acetyltransferase [Luteolibacter luteus]QJE97608.1 GNAT family N-acetyltransferase [Luteolibacter luteus]
MILETKRSAVLETARLLLRQPEPDDVEAIVRYAGDPRVALKTTAIPYPYRVRDALEWLDAIEIDRVGGAVETFAIERKTVPGLIGVISLALRQDRCSAEVGYWLGVPYWRCGYATESLREVLRHAFVDRGLLYVTGWHMIENPASGKVMQKGRMIFENIVAGGIKRGDEFHDRVNYGLFADEWQNAIA